MRKNIKFLRQNKPEKPEDALHEFSWNDYMEEDK